MSRVEIPGIHSRPNLDEGHRTQLGSVTFDSVPDGVNCASCTLNVSVRGMQCFPVKENKRTIMGISIEPDGSISLLSLINLNRIILPQACLLRALVIASKRLNT